MLQDPNNNLDAATGELSSNGAQRVVAIEGASFENYSGDAYAKAVADAFLVTLSPGRHIEVEHLFRLYHVVVVAHRRVRVERRRGTIVDSELLELVNLVLALR